MRARSKNETSHDFHSNCVPAGIVQWLDHPTPAGQPAYAISAVHTDALGVQPHAVNYRCGKPYAHAFGCHAHPKHNTLPHIDRLSRACYFDIHKHFYAAPHDAWVGDQAASL